MSYFLLFYYVVDNYVTLRATHRSEHLRLVKEAQQKGDLVMAGALADPVDQALLVFRSADKKAIQEFIKNDPYVKNGLIKRWEIRPWTVVTD